MIDGTGSSGTLWLSHATGFNGGCWRPVIDELNQTFRRVIVWDYRGHGRSGQAPMPVSWWDMGNDVLSILAEIGSAPGPSIAVGHSMGGAALVMAEASAPGAFDAMVLVEPILLGDPVRRISYPLAEVVRKRRREFVSRERALANFGRKAPFSHWHPNAVEGYVAAGLQEEGATLVLSCLPEFEADVYDAARAHGAFRLLDQIAPPVVVMMGEEADTFGIDWAQEIVAALPSAALVVVAGGDHFLPMSHPELVAREVRHSFGRLAQKAE